tara:strand:- start:1413 stop:1610 length:198 start_codon:yes stop_codon:yes gene_type:complete
MKNIFLVSFLMINVFNLFSQTQGKVLNSVNQPIKDVSVFLTDQNIIMYSDKDGAFLTKYDIPNNS